MGTKRHLLHPRLLSRFWTNSEPAATAALEDGVCLSLAAGMALGAATDLALAAVCVGSAGAGLADEAFRPGPEPFVWDLGGTEVGLPLSLDAHAACLGNAVCLRNATGRGFSAASGAATDPATAAGADAGALTALLSCLAVAEPVLAEEDEGLAARVALLALLLGLPPEAVAALPAVLSFGLETLIAVL